MSELEERIVLTRAFPSPSATETESALGLVRFRLPARRPRNWLGGLTRIAAALMVTGSMLGVGLRLMSHRPNRGEAIRTRPDGMPILLGESSDSLTTGVASVVRGKVDGTRRFHFRLFETLAGGSRRTIRDTTVAAVAGSDLRLTGWGADSLPSGMLPRRGSTADITAHVMPGGALRLTYDHWRADVSDRRSVQVPRGAVATVFPNGAPHGGQRRIGLEISLDTGRAAVSPVAANGKVEWPGLLSIQLLPRVQGAFMKIEVGDGTTWRTVYDRPRLVLMRMPAVFFLPDAPITEARVHFELSPDYVGSSETICMNWWPSDGRTVDGVCLPGDGAPRVVPIYRPTNRMLRITVLESFIKTPWER